MSKVVKGIRKAIKKIGNFFKKAWKTVTKSTIGKIALAAVAMYFLAPVAQQYIAGLSGAGGAGTGVAAEGMLAPVVDAVPTMAAGTSAGATAGATAGASLEPIAGTFIGQSGVQAGTEAALRTAMTSGAGGSGAGSGIIGSFLKNPIVQQSIAGGVANAFSPDELDILREQEKAEQRRREMAYSGIDNINIGVRPVSATDQVRPASPLAQVNNLGQPVYNSYKPNQGIIARNMMRSNRAY